MKPINQIEYDKQMEHMNDLTNNIFDVESNYPTGDLIRKCLYAARTQIDFAKNILKEQKELYNKEPTKEPNKEDKV